MSSRPNRPHELKIRLQARCATPLTVVSLARIPGHEYEMDAMSILIFGVLLAVPASAWADDGNLRALIRKVGIHGNLGVRNPTDSDVTRGVSVGPSVGVAPGHSNGWKYPFAFNMFSEYLHGPNGQQFGTVHTRALAAGIGYGWHFGQLSIGPDVEVGYAFNHTSVTGDAGAFEESGPLQMHAANSWLLRPELKAEVPSSRAN